MIRAVAPGDLWALRRKPRTQVVLYNEALLVQPHRPLWFSLRCLFQGVGRERAMMVYRDRGVSASVQSQARNGRPEQDILYLSVQGPDDNHLPSDHDLWFRLIERLCFAVSASHVQRLYTAIWRDQVELREIFRQLGFQTYTHRYTLQLSGPDWDQGTTLSPMRVQSRRDAWAIHKLYGAVTPRMVQQVEVRTPRAWMLPITERWQVNRRRAWVLGPQDDLHAYLHVLSGPEAHVFSLLLHPSMRDIIADVVRFGLAQLMDSRPVYLLLREYQQELLIPMQNLGFEPMSEEALLVKNTVVPVRRSRLVPAFETKSLDAPVSVPSISIPKEDSNSYVTTTPGQ